MTPELNVRQSAIQRKVQALMKPQRWVQHTRATIERSPHNGFRSVANLLFFSQSDRNTWPTKAVDAIWHSFCVGKEHPVLTVPDNRHQNMEV